MNKQTCPRRMNEFGPWKYKENLDIWNKRGPDRVCSFCGSMHPEDFEKFLQKVIEDESLAIEHSDKSYKIYIRDFNNERNGVNKGAIKYYKQHNYTNQEDIDRIQKIYPQALEVSKQRLYERTQKIIQKIKNCELD